MLLWNTYILCEIYTCTVLHNFRAEIDHNANEISRCSYNVQHSNDYSSETHCIFPVYSTMFSSRAILRLDVSVCDEWRFEHCPKETSYRREGGLEMTRHVKPLTVSQSNCVDLCGGRFEATDNAACRNVKTPKWAVTRQARAQGWKIWGQPRRTSQPIQRRNDDEFNFHFFHRSSYDKHRQ